MPKRTGKGYRPISPVDTAATTGLPNNPNGTYVANNFPQGNAQYGAQGQYGSMLPTVNVAGSAPIAGAPGTRFPIPISVMTGGTTTGGAPGLPPMSLGQPVTPPPPGYGNVSLDTTYGLPPVPTKKRGTEINITSSMLGNISSGNLADTYTPSQILALRNAGFDTSTLAGYFQFGEDGNLHITQQGKDLVKEQQQQTQTAPQQNFGSAPFGVNSSGQRLDKSGNVWDPKTATRDIYGGAFVQPGQIVKENGKRYIYLSGGKRMSLKDYQRKHGGGSRRPAAQQAQAQQQANAEYTLSNGFINFNTATG